MKKGNLLISCVLILLCLPVAHVFAQSKPTMKIYSGLPPGATATAKRNPNETTPVESFIRRVKQTNKFAQISNIWAADNNFDQTAMLQKVTKAQPLLIDYTQVANLIQNNTTAISLVIPGIGGSFYTIDLAQYSYLGNSFEVHAVAGNTDTKFDYTPGKYYSGVVDGIPGSVAAFSFFNNEVFGIFSIPGVGNMVLVPNSMPGVGKYYNSNQHYILYNDQDLKIKDLAPGCDADMLPEHPLHRSEISTTTLNNNVYNNCKEVRVFEVADYATYLTEGSSNANTTNYITALFNNQATLYRNEGIPIVLNFLQINSTSDQYSALPAGTSQEFLDEFGYVTQNNLHGSDLAILAATDQNGGYGALGGLAWLQSACSSYAISPSDTSGPYAFCDLDAGTSVTAFPTYSWDVTVMTHEMGHEVGSPHTHRCCWNPPGSGNTAIDCCYCEVTPVTDRLEASPTGAPLCAIPTPETPTAGGTIMSYCHLISTGINFSNGFGTQPGDTVRYYVANNMPCSIQYNPSTALQTASRSISANSQCTDLTSGITYYFNDNNTADQGDDTLVLMAKLGTNTIGDLNTSGFAVTANTDVRYGSGSGDTVTFPAGTSASLLSQNYSMRRYWNITPTSAPATAVEIMFPFLSTDTLDVHGSVGSALAPLSGYLAYIAKSPINPDPISGFTGSTASSFQIYTNGATPTTTNWALTTVGSTQFADMMTTDVAVGGSVFYTYCAQLAAPTGIAPTAPCPTTVVTYSVTPVAGAASYVWTVSGTGWSGTSTTNSINLTAGTGVATITCGAVASCGGTGDLYTLNITPSPLPAETLSTTTALCTGFTSVGLSATPTAGSPTSYTWTVSGTGWSGSGTTSAITAVAGTGTGTVTVTGTNSCGVGPSTTLLVTMNEGAPAAPTSITPPALACPTSTATFTTPAVPGATSYNWSVAGTSWSGSSSSTSINVNVGTGVGTLTVSAANACGTSSDYSANETTSTAPGTVTSISGPATPCTGTTVTFTAAPVATASSYVWTVSGTGWSGTSTTNSINVVTGSGAGTISVSPVNACGTGAAYTMPAIAPIAAPTATFTMSSHVVTTHSPVSIVYTGIAPTGATFSWNFSGGYATPGTGSGVQSVYWNAPGQYIVFLTVSNGTGCSASYADTIDVLTNTGIQNVNSQSIDASIVPNPNNGTFDILFGETVNQLVSVKLFDMLGQVVYNNDFTNAANKKLSVETNNLPPGTYTVSIYVNQSVITKKVTIYK